MPRFPLAIRSIFWRSSSAWRSIASGVKANYTAVLEELHRQGFKGVMSIEYEHDSPKLMDDVAECLAFVEKTAKAIGG